MIHYGCGNCIRESCTCRFILRIHRFITIRDHESDSKKVQFVPYNMNRDLFHIVDHESLMFLKDLVRGFDS
jgi:hypothetical protein